MGKPRIKSTTLFMTKKLQDKVITAPPKQAIQIMEKQIVQLDKNQKSYARKDKPETKYQDWKYGPIYLGTNTPAQLALLYPSVGAVEGQRVGSKIKNVKLQLKGMLTGNTGNINGGRVTFYILMYKRQRSITSASLYNAISNLDGIGPFILPDVQNRYTQQSFRDFEHIKDWQVIKKINFKLSADQLASAEPLTNFYLNCKLKDVQFDFPTTTVITKGMCQIFAVCNRGILGYPEAPGDGFALNFTYRLTYTDS
jgi:hypothetical protein